MYPQIKNTIIHLRISNHQAFTPFASFFFFFRLLSILPPSLLSLSSALYLPLFLPSCLFSSFILSLCILLLDFFKYKFIYFNWRLITLQYCSGFAIILYAILPLHTKSASQKIRIIYYKATVSIKFSRLRAMN